MALRDQLRKAMERAIRPLKSRVYNIVARAVVTAINDSGKMQVIKVSALAGEDKDSIEYFQDYGFTSVPKTGAEAVIVCPQGNRDHMIAVKVGDRTVRLKGLQEGEVAVYTDEGDKIHFKRGGTVQVVAATKVDIDSTLVEIGLGTLEKILNGETFRAFFNAHTHLGNLGVPTGVPTTLSPASHLSNVVKGAK
jgi:phage baseplate assembly protein V